MRKKIYFAAVLFALTVLINGCSKKEDPKPTPVADFSYSGANTFAPATVTFSNNSSNSSSYAWDFGDNGTATTTSPQHTYTSGGVYTVKLTATGEGGSNSASKTVNIQNAPSSCTITNVSILTCPLVDAVGTGWDFSTPPDFYIYCPPGVNETSNYHIDNANFPQSWTENWTINSANFGTTYTMAIWEHDSPDADDYVSSATFVLSDYTTVTNHYPTEFTITNGTTQIKITVSWN